MADLAPIPAHNRIMRGASDALLSRISPESRPFWAIDLPKPKASKPSILGEGVGAFVHSLGPGNAMMAGAGIRALTTLAQNETMYGVGRSLEKWGETTKAGRPASMPSVEGVGTALRWATGAVGQGLGSIAVPLAGGGLGALAGAKAGPPGVAAGAVGGAFSANFVILAGEALRQFEEAGVDGYTAARAAVSIAPVMAGFDTLGLAKVLRGPARGLRQGLLGYVGRRISHGASVEAATEAAQGMVRELTEAHLTGKPEIMQRAASVVEEAIAAGLTGGFVGGVAGGFQARRRQAAAPPPQQDEPVAPRQQAPPVQEEPPPPEDFGELQPEPTGAPVTELEVVDERAGPTIEDDLFTVQDETATAAELGEVQRNTANRLRQLQAANPSDPAVQEQIAANQQLARAARDRRSAVLEELKQPPPGATAPPPAEAPVEPAAAPVQEPPPVEEAPPPVAPVEEAPPVQEEPPPVQEEPPPVQEEPPPVAEAPVAPAPARRRPPTLQEDYNVLQNPESSREQVNKILMRQRAQKKEIETRLRTGKKANGKPLTNQDKANLQSHSQVVQRLINEAVERLEGEGTTQQTAEKKAPTRGRQQRAAPKVEVKKRIRREGEEAPAPAPAAEPAPASRDGAIDPAKGISASHIYPGLKRSDLDDLKAVHKKKVKPDTVKRVRLNTERKIARAETAKEKPHNKGPAEQKQLDERIAALKRMMVRVDELEGKPAEAAPAPAVPKAEKSGTYTPRLPYVLESGEIVELPASLNSGDSADFRKAAKGDLSPKEIAKMRLNTRRKIEREQNKGKQANQERIDFLQDSILHRLNEVEADQAKAKKAAPAKAKAKKQETKRAAPAKKDADKPPVMPELPSNMAEDTATARNPEATVEELKQVVDNTAKREAYVQELLRRDIDRHGKKLSKDARGRMKMQLDQILRAGDEARRAIKTVDMANQVDPDSDAGKVLAAAAARRKKRAPAKAATKEPEQETQAQRTKRHYDNRITGLLNQLGNVARGQDPKDAKHDFVTKLNKAIAKGYESIGPSSTMDAETIEVISDALYAMEEILKDAGNVKWSHQPNRVAIPEKSSLRIRVKALTGKGMTVEAAQKVADKITQRWNSDRSPEVRVIEDFWGLPEVTQERLFLSYGEDSDIQNRVKGIYYRGTSRPVVYVVASNIENAAMVKQTVAHEILGHHGIQSVLGEGHQDTLAGIWLEATQTHTKDHTPSGKRVDKQIRDLVETVQENYAEAFAEYEKIYEWWTRHHTHAALGDELVAKMAEGRIRNPVMLKVAGLARKFLRALGFDMSFAYDDIMSALDKSEQFLRGAPANPFSESSLYLKPEQSARTDTDFQKQVTAASRGFMASVRTFPDQRVPPWEWRRPMESFFRALSIPLGGLDAQGNLKIGAKAQKQAGYILKEMRPDPNGRFRWMDIPLQTVRHGWLNRYGTPKDFIVRERKKFADAHDIIQNLVGFLETMTNLSYDDAVILQEVLEGKVLDDERMNRLAEPVRQSIMDYGKELVEKGVLPEEAYTRNLGTYLHRSYRQYEFGAPAMVQWGRKMTGRQKAGIWGDVVMRRGRVHHVSQARLLQSIRKAPQPVRDAAKRATKWRIYERRSIKGLHERVYIPELPAGLRVNFASTGYNNLGTWDVRRTASGKPYLWRDYTEAEREQMGEIRDARYNIIRTYELLAHDIASARFFDDISKNPAWFSRAEPEGNVVDGSDVNRMYTTIAGIDWVKVPDTVIPKTNTKRWGELAGGYLRAPIWRDLFELNRMQNPGWWGWLLREWKKNKTTRSPTVHFNNTVGNLILSEIHDFTFGDIVRGLREFKDKSQYYQEAVTEGVFGSGFMRTEIHRHDAGDVVEKIIREVEQADNIERGNMKRVWDLITKIDRTAANVYRWEDEVFRLVSFIKDRERGVSKDQAAQNAVDRFLNYDIRAPWPNALRQSVLPFLSYTYAFVPQWMKAMSNKPWKIAKLYTIGYLFQAMAYDVTGGDEDQERRVMAERDQGFTWAMLPKMLRVPFNVDDDPVYLGMTRILPGGGFTTAAPSGLPEWMMISGPILMASEMLLNKVSFTGQEIVKKTDTAAEQGEKWLSYLWQGTMPNLTFLPGTWGYKTLTRSIMGETDIFGRAYPLSTAIVRQFGPRLYPHNVQSQRARRMFEIQKDMSELQLKARRLALDHQLRRISKSTLDSGMRKIQDHMQRLQARVRRVSGGT